MSKQPSNEVASQLTFEQSLERLDEIVHSLEDGKLGLSESLEQYEEGVRLLRQSYELLQRAERKIELLSGIDSEGNPVTEPFDDTATIDAEDSPKRRSRRRSTGSESPE